jgi:3-hydroxyisobutyrate dehydrogenase-like beta-hydroxyacid dehydrogenase
MEKRVAFIGFGEAATAFAPGLSASLSCFDIDPVHARIDGVRRATSDQDALAEADAALSLVTADQALAAAASAAPHLRRGALWLDMNSVAPATKLAASELIEAAGGRYVDVAIMAPAHPARTGVPLLLSGLHAEAGADLLRAIGFASVRVVPGAVGRASSIKMIRSVMVKGIEALTAECVLAAAQADVLDEVLVSLDAGSKDEGWAARADYNLERMLRHGLRRAAEMEEVVKTLDAFSTGSAMTRGTVERQRAIGVLGLAAPATLPAKIAAIRAAA